MTSTDPQDKVNGEAEAIVRNLTRAVQRNATEDERITAADVYDTERVEAWRYLIGGGGPTSYATALKDSDGHMMILIEVYGWSEHAVRMIRGSAATWIARDLARAARGDL